MVESACANTGRPLASTDVLAVVLATYSGIICDVYHKVVELEAQLAAHEHSLNFQN
jgi:hypothetical protein